MEEGNIRASYDNTNIMFKVVDTELKEKLLLTTKQKTKSPTISTQSK